MEIACLRYLHAECGPIINQASVHNERINIVRGFDQKKDFSFTCKIFYVRA